MATEKTELIRKIDFFAGLDDQLIGQIADSCREQHFVAGQFVAKQGELGPGLFLISSGKVKVEMENQGVKTVVAYLNSGESLGELSVIDEKPHSASVVCVEECHGWLLSRERFLSLLDAHPALGIQLARVMAGRLRRTSEVLARTAPKPPQSLSETVPEPARAALAEAYPEQQGSSKDALKDFLVGTFSRFYTMKALTRFSVAVVGCPVRVDFPEAATYADIDGVQIGFLPLHSDQAIRIVAHDQGVLRAAVLRAGTAGVESFSTPVESRDGFLLEIPSAVSEPAMLSKLHRPA